MTVYGELFFVKERGMKYSRLGMALFFAVLTLTGCGSGAETRRAENARQTVHAPADVTVTREQVRIVREPEDLSISGPYTHQNLAVYLIRGKDRMDMSATLTLKEALEQKIVTVHETGNVEELAVENVSGSQSVLILSGDIVKGGKQDRTIQFDFVVKPKSGRIPLASYCVEQSRWSRRGGENVACFEDGGSNQVVTNSMKLAARAVGTQTYVWREAEGVQEKILSNAGAAKQELTSESSFELTQDNKKVRAAIKKYTDQLTDVIDKENDAIGFAFAVNGEIVGSDIYPAHSVFRKLWPKLLNNCATEALARADKVKNSNPPNVDDVAFFLKAPDKGKIRKQDLAKNLKLIVRESDEVILFETIDTDVSGTPIRSCIYSKDEDTKRWLNSIEDGDASGNATNIAPGQVVRRRGIPLPPIDQSRDSEQGRDE